jgi:hypothetical protein
MTRFFVIVIFLCLFICNSSYGYNESMEMKAECGSSFFTFAADIFPASVFSIVSDKTGRVMELAIGGHGYLSEYACIDVDDILYIIFRGKSSFRYLDERLNNEELVHIGIQMNEIENGMSKEHQHQKQLDAYFSLLDHSQITSDSDFKEIINNSNFRKIASKKYRYIEKIYKLAKFKELKFEYVDD